MAYRLLFTGRLLLACVLSARVSENQSQAEEATKILHATSTILRHFVSLFPVALGSAEVLDETTRVCRVSSPETLATRPVNGDRFAWYRPLVLQTPDTKRKTDSRRHAKVMPHIHPDLSSSALPPASTEGEDPPPIDATFFRLGNVPTLSLFDSLGTFQGDTDFTWLLPGGDNNNLPYYFPPPS